MISAIAGTPAAEALGSATDALAAARVETPRLDAELLLCEATGWERARLASDPEAELPAGAGREFATMVRRRIAREPVAYITGRKAFREIELAVDRRALIPRPETELLVEIALELRPASVLDIGTGCGAVALAIAAELPGSDVVATDVSAPALELARENARALELAGRVAFEPGTLPGSRRFDLVVANLPYVREADWEGLAPEIRAFEPRGALVAGSDGLDAIRGVLAELTPGTAGAVALEVGLGQAGEVARLAGEAGFPDAELRADLAGVDRVVLAKPRQP